MPSKTLKWSWGEGSLRADFEWSAHDDVLTRHVHQPDGDVILDRNAELQKNPGAINDLSFGRLVLCIPFADRLVLGRKYPDLDSHDRQIRKRAWDRFMLSTESRPYRVQG